MGPLLIGGLIISLYFTVSAYRKTTMPQDESCTVKPLTACRALQNNASAIYIRVIKKFIAN